MINVTRPVPFDRLFLIAVQRIRAAIARSPVPEDPGHAENTLQWMKRLAPEAGPALHLAALAHDIERARPDRLMRHEFDDYDSFKKEHAAVGADIAEALLLDVGIDAVLRQAVFFLIRQHEVGGDPESDLLKDADSLSYFDHNLPFYYRREGWTNTLRRARWGYQRLSARAREYYCEIKHSDHELERLLHYAGKPGHPGHLD